MKKQQLSKVESRLIEVAQREAQRILAEAIGAVIEAHGFAPDRSQVVVEDGKFHVVEVPKPENTLPFAPGAKKTKKAQKTKAKDDSMKNDSKKDDMKQDSMQH